MSEALEQARAQVESIKRLVAALSVDYDRLDELREARDTCAFICEDGSEELDPRGWADQYKEEAQELALLEALANGSVDEYDAADAIHEDALSVEVRSGWRSPGRLEDARAEEFRIVLSTGGPHIELRGTLDSIGEPDAVSMFYSDGWAEGGELLLSSNDRDTVLTYCKQFYFGE